MYSYSFEGGVCYGNGNGVEEGAGCGVCESDDVCPGVGDDGDHAHEDATNNGEAAGVSYGREHFLETAVLMQGTRVTAI